MAKPVFRTVMKNQASLRKDILGAGPKLVEVVKAIIDANFIKGESYAKQNAPWTDRTGDARRSIASVDDSDANTIRYWLQIGVDYGIWLEIANQGKYRILIPTSTIIEANIIQDLRRIGVEIKVTP